MPSKPLFGTGWESSILFQIGYSVVVAVGVLVINDSTIEEAALPLSAIAVKPCALNCVTGRSVSITKVQISGLAPARLSWAKASKFLIS